MNKDFFKNCRKGDYQKDNFDKFLKAIRFDFSVPAVHVAGTNGKGSTVRFLEMSYIKAGYKIGSFTSPFFYENNEMIKVNNCQISDEDFLKIYNEYSKQITKFDLSEFEIETFIALTYFKNNNCDLCFIECGMGGQFDATNVFTPILSVITSVSLEHTAYLGKTLAEIAYSKAGIIKDYVPVVVGKLNSEAEDAIIDYANSCKTKVNRVVDPAKVEETNVGYLFSYETYANIEIKSKAKYILDDACIALECTNCLNNSFPISIEEIREGFATEILNGRFTILPNDSHVIVDGAHNPEGCEKLLEAINIAYPSAVFHIVFACFRDKNLERMLANLGEITNDITLSYFENERCRSEDDYFLFLGEYKYKNDPVAAVKELREQYPDDYVLVTGSLAFAGYMLSKLK